MFFADLHIHSKFSRATGRDADLEHMAIWARKKGVSVLGTGDFTHPKWFQEICEKLVPAEPGLFRLRDDLEREVVRQLDQALPGTPAPAVSSQPDLTVIAGQAGKPDVLLDGVVRFMLEVEISTIYKKAERTRKVHHLIYVPDFEAAERLIARLARIGNLASDGRPILGLDSRHLLEITLESSPHSYLVPAHIWTPWFAVLGSKSGFDAVEECYGDLTRHIFAVETGLSSDPPMNWRLSQLDRYTLVSNSDAHSPPKIGREACAFACDLDYFALRRALETRAGYAGTVEFFPEEGKYHLDGHRNCGVRLTPSETRQHAGRCPQCGKELTVGVMHRVDELADRADGFLPANPTEFRSLIPLPEVIAEIKGTGDASKQVQAAYDEALAKVGSELFILDQAPVEELRRLGSPLLAEAIGRMRSGRVIRDAGYDGEYGVIRVFQPGELSRRGMKTLLFETVEETPDDTDGHGYSKPSGVARKDNPRGLENAADEAQDAENGDRQDCAPSPSVSSAFNCSSILDGLDVEQRQAAEHVSGPLLIVAGPGTGKTRTLTHRVAHLVQNEHVSPEQCLTITFSRRAAAELKERLKALFEADRAGRAPEPSGDNYELPCPVMTFHALGLAILQEHAARCDLPTDFRIASEQERTQLVRKLCELTERGAAHALQRISRSKRTAPVGDPAAKRDEECAVYDKAMHERGWVDFDDLILRPAKLLAEAPDVAAAYRARWSWVSVDEFQDIDSVQYALLRLLVPSDGNVCVIGDPDQSIYGFRGADPRMFQRFLTDYPLARTVHLRKNYRSSATIVAAALQAIRPSSVVPERELMTAAGDTVTPSSRNPIPPPPCPTRPAARGVGSELPSSQAEPTAELIDFQTCATDKAEAEFVVHTIERLLGGSTFFSIDSGRVAAGDGETWSFGDFAVLYRTDAQAAALMDALDRSGIPYQRKSHGPLSEFPAVRAIARWMRQAAAVGWAESARLTNEPDTHSSARDNTATRNTVDTRDGLAGLADSAHPTARKPLTRTSVVDLLKQAADAVWSEFPDAATLLVQLYPIAERCGSDLPRFLNHLALATDVDLWDARADRVSLLTLHAAKGLEFGVVFLVGCEDGVLPLRFGSAGTDDIDEERRLFFVGMTRARRRLYVTRAKRRLWRGKVRDMSPSPFLHEIAKELVRRKERALKHRRNSPDAQLSLFE